MWVDSHTERKDFEDQNYPTNTPPANVVGNAKKSSTTVAAAS
jgi:hypothetical protein